MKIAIYAGSFDPCTFGHLHMIIKGSELFDHLYVAIGKNPAKKHFFSSDERKEMLNEIITQEKLSNVSVTEFSNQFLINHAKDLKAKYLLRGIRNSDDFNYEFGIKEINSRIDKEIETVFIIPPRNLSDVSSSVVKGLIGYDNWEEIAKQYVPEFVLKKLLETSKKAID